MNKSCSTSHINLINGASKGRKKNGSPQCHTRSFSPLRQVLTSHLPSRTPCLLMEESPRSSCTPAAQESWIAESQIYLESFSFQINHLAWIGSMHRSPRTQDILQPACAVLLIACRDKGDDRKSVRLNRSHTKIEGNTKKENRSQNCRGAG
jgi:hypothetical protein